MKKYFVLLSVAGSLFSTAPELDSLIEEFRLATNVTGAAVGIVVNGEVILAKGYGTRNGIDPVTTKTLFAVGSATKAFTSFAIGRLVDEGILRFDDPISLHIPYFRLKDPHTTYNVTIRDYLAHLSGYDRHDAMWFNEAFPRDALIKRLYFLDPIYPLREKFLYQNIGYTVAGHTAEIASGISFEELVAQKIFTPLNMTHSTFSLSEMQNSGDFSLGYQTPSEVIPFVDATSIAPAGGLNSNIEDMIHWLQLLLRKGEGLIEPATFEELITPQALSSLVRNKRYEVEKAVQMESYGLGWILISYRGYLIAMHGGNIDGFSSAIAFVPDENIALVILSNRNASPFAPLLLSILMDKLLHLPPINWIEKYEALATPDEEAILPTEVTHPSHPLSAYEGNYTHPGYGTVHLHLDRDHLVATFNKMILPLEHVRYNVFTIQNHAPLAVRGLRCRFQENCHGDIGALIIPFQGNDMTFKKEQDATLQDNEYLEQFVGNYTYMGLSFTVENSNQKLTAKAFGQPPYELLPEKKNLFRVKGLDGYTVQFTTDDSGSILAIQLIQANGTIYRANKV